MKIILDTNISISALISKGFRQRLTRVFDDSSIIILTDETLLTEIEDVSARPKIRSTLAQPNGLTF